MKKNATNANPKMERVYAALEAVDKSLPDLGDDYNKTCDLIIEYLRDALLSEGVVRSDIFTGGDVLYLQFPEPYYGKTYDLNGKGGGNGYHKVYGIFKLLNRDTIILHADYYEPLTEKEPSEQVSELASAMADAGKRFMLMMVFQMGFVIDNFSRGELISLLNILTGKDMDNNLAPSEAKMFINFKGMLKAIDNFKEEKS